MKVLSLVLGLMFSFSLWAVNRPNLQIDVTSFCICDNGISVSGQMCKNFCELKKSHPTSLFAVTSIGAGIAFEPIYMSKESGFGSLDKWCNQPLPSDNRNPRCILVLTSPGW